MKDEYDRCQRCGRRLKTEEARKRGYGSCCWKKHNKSVEEIKSLNLFSKSLVIKN